MNKELMLTPEEVNQPKQQFGSWQELHDLLSPWNRRILAAKRKLRESRRTK